MEPPTHAFSDAPLVAGRYQCGDPVRLGERTLLFQARDLTSNKRVLALIDEPATDQENEPTWERLREIDHPVLLEVVDHRVEQGRTATIYEAPPGEPLKDIVGERFGERVSRREALDVVDTLLSALEEFHEQGAVHGSIGPDTVFLSDDGSVRLLPMVTAPSETVADPRWDVLAVGELLRVMIAGLGTEGSEEAISDAGDEFALLVEKATAADPDHRPRDAAQYRALVRRARERLPSGPGRHAASNAATRQTPVTEPDTPRTRRRRPLLIGVAIALPLLLVAALSAWFLTSTEDGAGVEPTGATMPDLVGLSPEEATEHLDGLAVSIEVSYDQVRDNDVEPGLVAATTPGSGTAMTEGDAVTLSVATGPEELSVPDLVGQSEADAREVLADLGFEEVTVVQEASESEPSGTVLETDPEAGRTVAHDEPVTLTVSEGVTLPDLVGQSEGEAFATLDGLGLVAEVVMAEESTRPEGEVISHSPAVGAIVEPESTVVLTLSPGPDDEDDDTSEQGASGASGREEGQDTGDGRAGGDRPDGHTPGRDEEPTESAAAPEVEPCVSASWSQDTTYPEGSRVVHEGHEYEAVWWNNDISPADTAGWGPWREVGAC